MCPWEHFAAGPVTPKLASLLLHTIDDKLIDYPTYTPTRPPGYVKV